MTQASVFDQQSPAHNEFRSDTFTTPTASMAQAIHSLTLGDAVYDEDKSTTDLEEKVAKIAGKEAGLYCVSGTLSNQIAVRTNLLQPPFSVLCDSRSHIYVDEAGGIATLSQVMPAIVYPKNEKYLTLEDDILPNFIPDDGEIHSAPTKLISLENTLHGMIYPLEEIKKISEFCKQNDVRFHCDGARLWNASVESGIPVAEYCKYFDSVSLCLSKTLGAPIGSVLVGDAKFIRKANHFKKQNGGGIRQSGILAKMAEVAIDENLPKLKQTHQTAKEVGELCEKIGLILKHPVETNFVFIDVKASKLDPEFFQKRAKEYGLKIEYSRITFHYQHSQESIESCKKLLVEAAEYAKKHPYETKRRVNFYPAGVQAN